ncbi:MAG: MmgE/PrpD family protein [Nitrososphaerota archaeon]|nr:MmgE/PrpD family protein [Nitrososphaerota archaeon]MDG6975146.1 MmgE/PrpD family protein [Nitrososphaerota archaeon]
MDLAERLAKYALSTEFRSLDSTTVKEMKARVVDALGCALGAFGEGPVEMARRSALKLRSGGESRILGTGSRSSPDLATFVNGFMIRYFDYNDTYLSKEPAHPSDNLAPCFAVAEAEGSTGKEFVAAAVAAYEVQCRLCDAADIRHRGWDHVNYGLVSSSLAASKLMNLPLAKATQAVNLALNGHIAMRQVRAGELSMWKGASFANAARNGVFAASLAREGITGPSPIFEGEMGFFRQVSGPFEVNTEEFGGRKGRYKVNGTYVKYWPAEYHAQSAIWAALEIRKRQGDVRRAESVLIQTHEAAYTILGRDPEKWAPKTKETADHSLPYMVAKALLDGRVDNSTYSSANLRDPRTLALMAKVKVVEDLTLTSLYPDRGMANRITVSFAGGGKETAQVDLPKGHPANPMTKDDIEAKFLRLVGRHIDGHRARRVLKRLWALEDEKEAGSVLGLLRVA